MIAKRRLAHADRRAQLIDAARKIVTEQGAAALTLARVGERADVAKPVVYDHFGTVSGLLIALYKAIDREQGEALRRALADEPHDLDSAALRIAEAYMRCCVDTEGEGHAIAGALQGSPEMMAAHRELLDDYIGVFADGLARHSPLPAAELRLRCAALVGAAEALASQMTHAGLAEATATETLRAIIVASVSAPAG